jgi:hypothetical protein
VIPTSVFVSANHQTGRTKLKRLRARLDELIRGGGLPLVTNLNYLMKGLTMKSHQRTSPRRRALVGLLIAGTLVTAPAQASTYKFNVVCESQKKVVEWKTGAIDPGREYLRVITGTKNPNCQVSDYGPADGALPTEKHSHEGAILQGLPPVAIICALFRC